MRSHFSVRTIAYIGLLTLICGSSKLTRCEHGQEKDDTYNRQCCREDNNVRNSGKNMGESDGGCCQDTDADCCRGEGEGCCKGVEEECCKNDRSNNDRDGVRCCKDENSGPKSENDTDNGSCCRTTKRQEQQNEKRGCCKEKSNREGDPTSYPNNFGNSEDHSQTTNRRENQNRKRGCCKDKNNKSKEKIESTRDDKFDNSNWSRTTGEEKDQTTKRKCCKDRSDHNNTVRHEENRGEKTKCCRDQTNGGNNTEKCCKEDGGGDEKISETCCRDTNGHKNNRRRGCCKDKQVEDISDKPNGTKFTVDGTQLGKMDRVKRDLGINFRIKNATKKGKKNPQQAAAKNTADKKVVKPTKITVSERQYPELPKEYEKMVSELNKTDLLETSMSLNKFRSTLDTFDDYADEVKNEMGFDISGRTEFVSEFDEFLHRAQYILKLRLYKIV